MWCHTGEQTLLWAGQVGGLVAQLLVLTLHGTQVGDVADFGGGIVGQRVMSPVKHRTAPIFLAAPDRYNVRHSKPHSKHDIPSAVFTRGGWWLDCRAAVCNPVDAPVRSITSRQRHFLYLRPPRRDGFSTSSTSHRSTVRLGGPTVGLIDGVLTPPFERGEPSHSARSFISLSRLCWLRLSHWHDSLANSPRSDTSDASESDVPAARANHPLG